VIEPVEIPVIEPVEIPVIEPVEIRRRPVGFQPTGLAH
jgi:hypothetical protein